MNPLRSYMGRDFDPSAFQFVGENLRTSLQTICERVPDRDFLHWISASGETRRWTYKDFWAEAGRVRGWLEQEKINSETVICTIAGNSPHHLAWIVGAITAGHAIALIDPAESPFTLKKKLDALPTPRLILVEGSLVSPEFQAIPFPALERGTIGELRPPAQPDRMIQVFTSGSTGYSKVVQQSERAVLANVEALIRHHRLYESKTVLTSLPVFHVNCLTFGFLSTLLAGGTLVLMERFDLGLFFDAVQKYRVQVVSAIPPILHLLSQRQLDLGRLRTGSLQYFVTAAAALAPELARRLCAEFPVPVFQGYGLSEAVNFSCTLPTDLSRSDLERWLTADERPSIGVPLEFNSVHIVDEAGAELTEGEVGELCVRGWNVMTGYLDDDGKQVFAGDYLHTGDLGYFRTDDSGRKFFFINGRRKEMIKRLGETVSLVEIDDLLTTFVGGYEGAISVPFANEHAGEEIAIVVQTRTEEKFDFSSLEKHLRQHLAEKSWPRLYAQTLAPVRTSSGKSRRWTFNSSFLEYRSSLFGKVARVHPSLIAGPVFIAESD